VSWQKESLREFAIVRLAVVGLIKRLNELKVSRQIRKLDNELKVFREVRKIDNEYEALVKSAAQDQENRNIAAKYERWKAIYGPSKSGSHKPVAEIDFVDAPKSMKFLETIKFSYQNYSNFTGRASRSEFWYWVLFVALTTCGLAVVASFEGSTQIYKEILLAVFVLSSISPTLSRVVRRLHDTDKPGIYALFWFTPIVGYVLLTVWLCAKSDLGGNRFGPVRDNHELPTLHRAPHRGIKPVSGQHAPQSRSSLSFLRKLLGKILS
jgi:uncharacterized membrane protein YhaH (DUF805 family)